RSASRAPFKRCGSVSLAHRQPQVTEQPSGSCLPGGEAPLSPPAGRQGRKGQMRCRCSSATRGPRREPAISSALAISCRTNRYLMGFAQPQESDDARHHPLESWGRRLAACRATDAGLGGRPQSRRLWHLFAGRAAGAGPAAHLPLRSSLLVLHPARLLSELRLRVLGAACGNALSLPLCLLRSALSVRARLGL